MHKVRRITAVAIVIALFAAPATVRGVGAPVSLGTAAAFAVLGAEAVTNTGPTLVGADLGVSPGSAYTGFPPGTVTGSFHAADSVAAQAQSDLTAAYNNAAGQASDFGLLPVAELGGLTLTPGVYTAPSSILITGTLTLDAQDDPNAI